MNLFSADAEIYAAGARYLQIVGTVFAFQGLAAAFETVGDEKHAHSLHAYFLETGRAGAPIGYQATRLRNGRPFATHLR